MSESEPQKITPRQAAVLAAEYFLFITGWSAKGAQLRTEEIEMSEDGKYWLITLSHIADRNSDDPFWWGNKNRDYKQFTIDAELNSVLSMKIRKLD